MAVRIERDGPVAVVTMSRPEAFNAFNTEQLRALRDAVAEVSADRAIRAVVLTGEGRRAFASGADIKEMSTMRPSEGLAFGQLGQSVTAAIEAAPQPWIAAINGYALGGGCEMALACDIRLASENAAIGQPEVTLGILPGWGATQRLSRLVGAGLASELILTGRRLTAGEAREMGLVNAVYTLDELLPKATDMARAIAANAPLAVSAAKRAILLSRDVDLTTGLAYEAQTFGLLFDSEDQKAGMTAFLEKRTAEFEGN
ncbi:MAG TPA: enoyl-CoA hydratase-related protein [Thermomicrobiales bacterium]|nr:enoyl-CoA hydratase-related protein [Thermomicrobiales bacterium]